MKQLYLFLSINNKDIYVGVITININHGSEVFSFEYSQEYLKDKNHYLIDPSLFDYLGPQYDIHFINDMTPDRFGSILIDKMEQISAVKENRLPRKLLLSDYLLRVNDLTRMGALRIKEDINGPFINDDKNSIPLYVYLRDIEHASIELEENGGIDDEIYKRLLLPGSSLGGARPKANVYYNNEVYFAKFPSKKDDYDVELWEYIINNIARTIGINVPPSKIDKFSNYGHTLLLKRFDRNKQERIHYISAVTALSTYDGESSKYSYLDLANFLISHSSNIKEDLTELYKRMVFTYIINNTDNHLRNHAFIINDKGITLAPAYDINPSFYQTVFELAFGMGNSVEGLIKIAKYFRISEQEAQEIVKSTVDKTISMINESMDEYKNIKKEAEILINIIKSRSL